MTSSSLFPSPPPRSFPPTPFGLRRASAPLRMTEKNAHQLIESILFSRGSYHFLADHLHRLSASANYFQYPCDLSTVRAALEREACLLNPGSAYKVRLLLSVDGSLVMAHERVQPKSKMRRPVLIAATPVLSSDPWLYHKTTQRNVYDAARKDAQAQGFFDVLFQNERGDITESSIANVFIQLDGQWLTPPVHCGLLNGVYRQHLLKKLKPVQEKAFSENELLRADRVLLCNSVRGVIRVRLSGVMRDSEILSRIDT